MATSGGLPIELTYFDAELENKVVKLRWQTATKSNNDYFEIQCSSNGITFKKIYQLDLKSLCGHSAYTLNYEVEDLNPKNALNYYRLNQVDFNGESDYSRIIAIDLKNSSLINFYPNPASNKIYIECSENYKIASIKIINVMVVEVKPNTKLNFYDVTIDVSDLTDHSHIVGKILI